MMERRVVITGTGVVTPLGFSTRQFWDSLKAGRCGISEIEGLDLNVPVKVAGQIKDFDPLQFGMTIKDCRRNDRFTLFALAAAHQAMDESGLESEVNISSPRLGVYLGSGIGGMQTFIEQTKEMLEGGADMVSPLFIPKMISNIAGGNIAIKYNAQGPALTVSSACATGTNAVGEAYLAIKYGTCDAIIAGGSEAAINPLSIGGFYNAHALSTSEDPLNASLPFSANRGGFVIAEGAAVLVLEEYQHAINRGAEIIAEVTGYGNFCDAHHVTSPRQDGLPASYAVRAALEQSGYKPGEDLYINAHGTGTILNDKTETAAFKLALGEQDARRASISSTKSMTGHMIAATGAAELIASALALRDGIIPPTIGLHQPDPECDLNYTPLVAVERDITIAISNSLGFGGHDACVALRKYGD